MVPVTYCDNQRVQFIYCSLFSLIFICASYALKELSSICNQVLDVLFFFFFFIIYNLHLQVQTHQPRPTSLLSARALAPHLSWRKDQKYNYRLQLSVHTIRSRKYKPVGSVLYGDTSTGSYLAPPTSIARQKGTLPAFGHPTAA